MQRIAKGAEATVLRDDDVVIKRRKPKTYRQEELDDELREKRTKQEARILEKLSVTPGVRDVDTNEIRMDAVKGDMLTDVIDENPRTCEEVGHAVARVHDADIYHGDLTTSNVLVADKPVLIDFGLAGYTDRVEDKAVDLYLFHKALVSKHHGIAAEAWKAFLNGYDPDRRDEVLQQYDVVRKRGRYK